MMYLWGCLGLVVITVAVIFVRSRLIATSSPVPARLRSRGLFTFSDGVKTRSIDPIEAMMGFFKQPEFLHDKHPLKAQDGDMEALRIVAEAVRLAFDIPEFTEAGKPGLTIRECFELYCVFIRYVLSQKKSTNRSLTSLQGMESTSNRSEKPTTNDTLASGSIETGQGTSKDMQSSAA